MDLQGVEIVSDNGGLGGFLGLVLIISFFIVFGLSVLDSCCGVYMDFQYSAGVECHEYEDGLQNGYENHNESIYDQCVEYKSEHFDKTESTRITGDKGAYYYSWGYIEGYNKYLLDYKNSWLIEEMKKEGE